MHFDNLQMLHIVRYTYTSFYLFDLLVCMKTGHHFVAIKSSNQNVVAYSYYESNVALLVMALNFFMGAESYLPALATVSPDLILFCTIVHHHCVHYIICLKDGL
jgi:hypothetical protein